MEKLDARIRQGMVGYRARRNFVVESTISKEKILRKSTEGKSFNMPIVGHNLCLDLKLSIYEFIRLEAKVIIPLQIHLTGCTFDST